MITWADVVLDSGDDHRAVDFCSEILGADVRVQPIEGSGKVRVDFEVDDVAAETQRLVDLGATAVTGSDRAQTLRSPGGLLFGLKDQKEHGERPSPVGPAGRRTRLVQVCVDAPARLIDREVAFWRAMTAWRYVPRDSDLVGKLFPPPGSPIQLLLQRLGPDDRGVSTRAHVDLGCDDYAATAEQMIVLGAERLWSGNGWITLRDPAGMIFCATENSPDAP